MNYINSRDDLLLMLPKKMIITELGVFTGDFSEIILKNCEPKELHLVDIWEGSMVSADKDGKNMVHIQNMQQVYEGLLLKYANNPTIILHRKSTQQMLSEFADNYFDFIYIDALHSYEACYADLQMSYNKSKKYIAGHDYCNAFPGIVEAVDWFCKERQLPIAFMTKDGCPSFLIEKI